MRDRSGWARSTTTSRSSSTTEPQRRDLHHGLFALGTAFERVTETEHPRRDRGSGRGAPELVDRPLERRAGGVAARRGVRLVTFARFTGFAPGRVWPGLGAGFGLVHRVQSTGNRGPYGSAIRWPVPGGSVRALCHRRKLSRTGTPEEDAPFNVRRPDDLATDRSGPLHRTADRRVRMRCRAHGSACASRECEPADDRGPPGAARELAREARLRDPRCTDRGRASARCWRQSHLRRDPRA